MSIRRSCLYSALAFSVYAAAANAAQVHSGAGLQSGGNDTGTAIAGSTSRSHTPPPLPGSASRIPTPARGPVEAPDNYPTVNASQAKAITSSQQPPSSAVTVSFDEALTNDVNIDVVDMRFAEVIQKLAPTGWRVRFQHVDQAILNKRVDMTANAKLKDVLYELLSHADLAVTPFDGFDHPLLLVTSSQ